MIWVDWVLLALLAVSTIIGLWRGLVREVLSIVIWVVAIWAALRYSEVAAGYVSGWITVPSMQALVGFAGVLLVSLTIGGLLVWLIGKLVDSTGLSGTDRTFGMLFGIARGVIIIAVAVLVARFTAIPQDPWWQQSSLLPHFERLADEAVTLLPDDIQELLQADADSADSVLAAEADDLAADRNDATPVQPAGRIKAASDEPMPRAPNPDEQAQPSSGAATLEANNNLDDGVL